MATEPPSYYKKPAGFRNRRAFENWQRENDPVAYMTRRRRAEVEAPAHEPDDWSEMGNGGFKRKKHGLNE